MTQKQISGEDAFRLYDTYGFPLDLTQLLAAEKGLGVDVDGFNAEMDKQRERARAARKSSVVTVADDSVETLATPFSGYEDENLSYYAAEVLHVGEAGGKPYIIVTDTPFYAEMGGQVGDTGSIRTLDGWQGTVVNTIKDSAGRVLHILDKPAPETVVGHLAALNVDTARRDAIERHHTATHILHWALRKVLGSHAHQAGSLVTPERLRFDYTHYEAPTEAQLAEIERLANEHILKNEPVCWQEFAFEDKPASAMAFFGEKYGSRVRVVAIGEEVGTEAHSFDNGWSVELCGGTHVCATGEIGLLKVVAESSVSSGTRRIEAVCGMAACELAAAQFKTLRDMANRLSCKMEDLLPRLEAQQEKIHELEKELKNFQKKASAGQADELAAKAFDKDGIKILAAVVQADNPNALRQLGVDLQKKLGESIVVLAAASGDKGSVLALASDGAVKTGYKAGAIVAEIAGKLGGRGGGKPDFAMGGFTNVAEAAKVLASFGK
ncbi:MAG TPA: alanine--tRNA ligase-related protein [Opitutales bacterium]|nr:alanine--tRNA ligase-related protein [Opitutales bacterium]